MQLHSTIKLRTINNFLICPLRSRHLLNSMQFIHFQKTKKEIHKNLHAIQDTVNQKNQKLRKSEELQLYIIKCQKKKIKKKRKKEEVERCINRLRLSFEFHLKVILSINKLHLFKMSDLREYFATQKYPDISYIAT